VSNFRLHLDFKSRCGTNTNSSFPEENLSLRQAEYSQPCPSEDFDVNFEASEIMAYYSTQHTDFLPKKSRGCDIIFLSLLEVNMPLPRISHQGLFAQCHRSSRW